MEIQQGKPLRMLPPAAHLCQECAEDHNSNFPQNRDSLYYQFWFNQQYGRSPTWADACANCSEDVKASLKAFVLSKGILFGDEKPEPEPQPEPEPGSVVLGGSGPQPGDAVLGKPNPKEE